MTPPDRPAGGESPSGWRNEIIGLALIVLSATAYGVIPIIGKLAFGLGVRPAPLLVWRFVLGAVLLRVSTRSTAPWASRRRLWALGPVFAGNAVAYFIALETSPAAAVAVVLYLYPVLVAFLAALLAVEPLRVRTLIAAGVAFAGCALCAGGGFMSGKGIVFALLAAFLYALYAVLGSRFARGVGAPATALHVTESGAVVCVAGAAFRGGYALPADARAIAAVAAIATLSTVVAMRAFLAGAVRIGPGRAAVISSVEVLVTAVLAFTLLGERLRSAQWLGVLLVLGAVVLQNAQALRWASRAQPA